MSEIIQLFSTQNLKVAAALTAMGFQFESDSAPVTRVLRPSGQESTVFWFKAQHPETGEQAEQISRWMTTEADTFAEKNPEHPVAYMRAVLANRDELVGCIKNTPRQVLIERNGRTISISENATPEDRARFARNS